MTTATVAGSAPVATTAGVQPGRAATAAHWAEVAVVPLLLLIGGMAAIWRVHIAKAPHGLGGYELVMALTVLPLLLRRVAPIPVAVVVAATMELGSKHYHVPLSNASLLSLLVAVYGAAAYSRRRMPWLAWLIGEAGIVLLFDPRKLGWGEPLIQAALQAAAAVVGDLQWQSIRLGRLLEDRRLQVVEEASLVGKVAVGRERRRIAADIDSIIGKAVAEVCDLVEDARRSIGVRPAWARQALDAAAGRGRAALHELRRLLAVLRTPDDAPALGEAKSPHLPGSAARLLPGPLQRPWVQDITVFAALATFVAWDIAVHKEPLYVPHYGSGAIVMGVAITATVLGSRRFPWPSLGVAAVLSLLQTGPLNLRVSDGLPIVTAIIVFAISRRSRPAGALLAAALASASWQVGGARIHYHMNAEVYVVGLSLLGAAAGQVVRTRTATNDRMAERVEQLETQAQMQAELAALDERMRIARDMHDAVAHALSLMVVQAGGAASIVDQQPERARDALDAVLDAGRQASAEMQQLFELDAGVGPDLLETFRIEDLVAQDRASGTQVDLVVEGGADLSDGVRMSTYRIVQEALTNARKHAPGSPVLVHLRHEPGGLELRVTNEVREARRAVPGAGQGLHGMRERVVLLGGRLRAGPRDDGNYEVRAYLPDRQGA